MNLFDYVADIPRRKALAKHLGNSPDYLWQVATGRRSASPTLAMAIESHTREAFPDDPVLKGSLRPDIWPDDIAA